MEEIEIVYRKISDLTLLDDNPRKISKRDLERLVDSIRINGFWKHRPIALSEREGKLYVLAGHQRIKAAKKLKISEVPTILYHNLTEEQEADIVLRDNINNGEWDFEKLQLGDWSNKADFSFIGLDIPVEDKQSEDEEAADEEQEDNEKEEGLTIVCMRAIMSLTFLICCWKNKPENFFCLLPPGELIAD